MGFFENIRAWSNVNCALASLNSFGEQRLSGVSTGNATANLFANVTNGVVRNELAYGLAKTTGNTSGMLFNSMIGYGNDKANMYGSLAMMKCSSPWLFFNTQRYLMPSPFMPTIAYNTGFATGYMAGSALGYLC